MKQIIVFSGTTEGRLLSQALGRRGIPALACVATEYGGQLAGEPPRTGGGPHIWGKPVEEAVGRAVDAALCVMEHGVSEAQNRFN